MQNTKKNFVVYFKGVQSTVKISEHSSMIAAQAMVNDLKEGTKQRGYPYISVANPLLVRRMQAYG